jgi:hypothetical protein
MRASTARAASRVSARLCAQSRYPALSADVEMYAKKAEECNNIRDDEVDQPIAPQARSAAKKIGEGTRDDRIPNQQANEKRAVGGSKSRECLE